MDTALSQPLRLETGRPLVNTRAVAQHNLKPAIAEDQPTLLISITDPGMELTDDAIAALGHNGAVERLAYHAHTGYGSSWITLSDMRHLHGVLETLTADDRVLVHCSAGMMRSPVIALMVRLMHRTASIEDTVAAWRADHPNAEPHERTALCMADVLDIRYPKLRQLMDGPQAAPEEPRQEKRPLYGKASKPKRMKGFRV